MEQKKLDNYLKAAFRRIWRWSDKWKECHKIKKCQQCGKKGKLYKDHIWPVIEPKIGFVNWQVYYERMFFGELQALCSKCHAIKTQKENVERWRRYGK